MKPKRDLRDYTPDVAKVIEDSRPEAVRERRRKALEPLRQAGLVDRYTPEPASRSSAPRPADKAAQPSTMTPLAEVEPVTRDSAAERRARRETTWRVVVGLALVAVSAPILVALFGGRTKEPAVMPSSTTAPLAPTNAAPLAALASATPNAPPPLPTTPSASATATSAPMPTSQPTPHKPHSHPSAAHDRPDAAAPATSEPTTSPAPVRTPAEDKPEF